MASGSSEGVSVSCKFFASGNCNQGAACRFLHGGLSASAYVAAVAAGRPPRPSMPRGGGGASGRSNSAQRRPPAPPVSHPAAPQQQHNQQPRPGGGNRSGSAQRPSRPSSVGRQPPSRRDSFSSGATSDRFSAEPLSRRASNSILACAPATPVVSSGTSQKQDFLVRLENGQMATGQMTMTRQVVTTKPPLVVHAYFLLDASGSMKGARMEATLEYLGHMVRNVLSGDDLVTVWTFAEEEKLTQLYYKTQAANIKLETLGVKVNTGGCTRLYGNCVRALDSMRRDDRARDDRNNVILRNLVVFTDGCDNKSGEEGLKEMVEELRNHRLPHFYFTCMAVSQEGYIEGLKLQKALAGAKRAKVIITDKASKEEIAQAFGKAQACLREAKQELIERIELECRGPGTKPILGSLVSSAIATAARRVA